MWEVRNRSARVLLFGDSPAQRAPWRSARVEAAVAASEVFWRETPAGANPNAASQFLAKGVDAARPLSTWLAPAERARVAAAAAAVVLAEPTLERLRPWLAAVLLEDRFNAVAGFKSEYGPTFDLTAVALAAGAQVRSEFPDTAAVVDYFAGFSPAAEVGALLSAVDDIEAGAGAAEREGQAWAAGDLRPDTAAVLRKRSLYPAYYQRILAERNRRWVARIRTMLDAGGQTFLLVGSYHLVGPDSILNLLTDAGMPARRI
jgi:uncharacterized protein YbaP (TraB family)